MNLNKMPIETNNIKGFFFIKSDQPYFYFSYKCIKIMIFEILKASYSRISVLKLRYFISFQKYHRVLKFFHIYIVTFKIFLEIYY